MTLSNKTSHTDDRPKGYIAPIGGRRRLSGLFSCETGNLLCHGPVSVCRDAAEEYGFQIVDR